MTCFAVFPLLVCLVGGRRHDLHVEPHPSLRGGIRKTGLSEVRGQYTTEFTEDVWGGFQDVMSIFRFILCIYV